MSKNQCYNFSITYHFGEGDTIETLKENKDDFINTLKNLGVNKFIFQGEEGEETKRLHYQGYFHIEKKIRATQLNKLFSFRNKGAFIKPASKNGIQGLKNYCMKKDTRVCGPYADKVIYLGEDLPNYLLGWQEHLKNYILGPVEKREIIFIYDKYGGSGKSIFSKYMSFNYGCIKLTYGKQGDLLNLVCKNKNKRCYIFDLSRTKPSTFSNEDLYSSIEDIKNGHFINTKYETEEVIMNVPHVIVFANHLPRLSNMSRDMWNILELPENANPYKKRKKKIFTSQFFKKIKNEDIDEVDNKVYDIDQGI